MKSSEIKIFVGRREGYSSVIGPIERVKEICQAYCDLVGLCVSVTPTEFIYRGGWEPGVIVGLIRYPRFPETDLWSHARTLAWQLKDALGQFRVTIQDNDIVEMIGDA